MRDFVGTVSEAGCNTFIVHARNAWLQGLSPKENREVPPLRYELVHQLKREFPHLSIMLNGGVTTAAQIQEQLAAGLDGVMVGREAYHNPWFLTQWDTLGDANAPAFALTREEVEAQMVAYMAREAAAHGTGWQSIARHMLGLRNGLPGARRWRQVWSDHKLKALPPHEVMAVARQSSRGAVLQD